MPETKKNPKLNRTVSSSVDVEQKNETELASLHSKIENLEGILADKELFIDNLIERSGGLESTVLKKDEYADNLANEIASQKQHIKNLDKAIKQRDEHVAHLEARNSQTLDLLQKSQVAEKVTSNLKSSIKELHTQSADLDSLLGKQNSNINSLLDEQNRKLDMLLVQAGNLSEEVHTLRAQITEMENARSLNEATLVSSHAQEIARFQNEIEQKDKWGEEIQLRLNSEIENRDEWGRNMLHRLNQLDTQLSSVMASTSWRITKPLRLLSALIKFSLRKLGSLLLLPYRVLTKLGWFIAPKLFHWIYHLPSVQAIRNAVSNQKPVTGGQPHSGFATNTTKVKQPGLAETTSETRVHWDQQQKIPHGKWRLGERIDGPTNS